MFSYWFHAGTILFEHLGTNKTITTVLYKNDKGIKLDSCLKPAYMWLFTVHILAAGKAFKLDDNVFK